jgi:transposase InsO family protein
MIAAGIVGTCPKSRRLLVDRLEVGWSLRSAAEAAGISIRGAGHRVTGNRRSQFELGRGGERRKATGWEFVHVCVDDATRLAYVEGKAERFIQTLTNPWAYGAIYGSSAERTAALPGWLDHYNFGRGHGSLGHRPPAARLAELEQPRE